jgi:vitamin B12 transporter
VRISVLRAFERTTRRVIAALICVGLLTLTVPAWAQSDPDDPDCPRAICDTGLRRSNSGDGQVLVTINPDAITVIGRPLPPPIGDAAYDITTIDADRINGVASGRVEDVLKDVAGLTQFRRTDARSANATSQGATLRGLGGNASSRALLILDGVPQTDPFGGWVTWPAFAPERLGQIRVTRGGGSGSFGPGALAGTIEFSSQTTANGLSASAAYGSRGAVEGSALIGGKLGGGYGFISANYARGDGFIPIIAGQRGPADIASPYQQASLAARAVAPLSAQTEFQASVLAFTDRRQRGTILSNNGGDGADASLRLIHRGDWQWSALGYVQVRKFQSRFVAVDATRTTVTQTVDQYNVPSTGLGARFEVRPPLGETVELRLGGDWRRVSGQTNERFTYVAGSPTRLREAGGKSDTVGAFAEASAELGALTLTGGGRVDHWTIQNGRLIERTIATGALFRNDRALNRRGTESTGRAGLAYHFGPLTLRGAAYLGWRLPTLNELYRPFRVGADATAANAALSPERMKGAEIGLGWLNLGQAYITSNEVTASEPHTQLSLAFTAFTNRLTNAIANVSLGAGPGTFPGVGFVGAGGVYRQRQNIDAIRSRGVELDASWRVGDWHAQANYAYTDARVVSSGLALPLNGLRPAQVPTHAASATLGWKGLSTTLRYVSRQFEEDLNRRNLGDALTVDAVVSVPIGRRLAVTLRAENITNTRIDAAISGTGVIERASPRAFWIGLSVKP